MSTPTAQHQRDITPRALPGLVEEYQPQRSFPIGHLEGSMDIDDAGQVRALMDSIALARQMVFSARSIEILARSLRIRREGDAVDVLPTEEIVRKINEYAQSNVMRVVVQRGIRQWGFVHPDEPVTINLNDTHLERAGNAVTHNKIVMRDYYVFLMGCIIGHEIVRSVRLVFGDCSRDTPESGWSWEEQFLGGKLGFTNDPQAPHEPSMVAVLLKVLVDDEVQVRVLDKDKVQQIVRGQLGWEKGTLPFTVESTTLYTGPQELALFREIAEEGVQAEVFAEEEVHFMVCGTH